MATAMTVTICPRNCFDSCGLVYATATTITHTSDQELWKCLTCLSSEMVAWSKHATVCLRKDCSALAADMHLNWQGQVRRGLDNERSSAIQKCFTPDARQWCMRKETHSELDHCNDARINFAIGITHATLP